MKILHYFFLPNKILQAPTTKNAPDASRSKSPKYLAPFVPRKKLLIQNPFKA